MKARVAWQAYVGYFDQLKGTIKAKIDRIDYRIAWR